MEQTWSLFGKTFPNAVMFKIYLNRLPKNAGLQRVEEEDKIVYYKGINSSELDREYISFLAYEEDILRDMNGDKPVYIAFNGASGQTLVEQVDVFDPYPNLKTNVPFVM